jgi:translocator protein
MSKSDLLKLVISLVIPLTAGFVGSIFTTPNIGTWYRDLVKPALTAPNAVFGPVWTTLYVLMGIALFLVWRRGFTTSGVASAMAVFAVQMALNILWSLAFFGMRSPLAGVVVIILLWLAILATILRFRAISAVAAVLLAPYILWVSFATYLNVSIWRLN